ncbi:8282_t:CDS:2 [Ambispora leptoticha]|uniref:8282_t:CDS:1 n=1 Tax=Ambispora leptoticha TaxID=144679 RepID=A0A9N9FW45_9GLOM|nr:8282_t:CDS:2 [Ambispora leptoticha]
MSQPNNYYRRKTPIQIDDDFVLNTFATREGLLAQYEAILASPDDARQFVEKLIDDKIKAGYVGWAEW